MPGTEVAFVINLIRYMPDDKCEAYLRAVLQSLSPRRLERAIQIAREVQASVGAGMPGGK